MGSAGWLLVTPRASLLLVDFRYVEQGKAQAPAWEVVQIRGEPHQFLPPLLKDLGVKRLGLEAGDMTVATHSALQQALAGGPELVATLGLVEGLRAVKEPGEVSLMEEAAHLAEEALEYLSFHFKPRAREMDLAWQMEKYLREQGSEAPPFELIVASGPQGALPHARPTDRALGEGEPVVIDIGARVLGYTSDITRTLAVGHADDKFKEIYSIVLEAQEATLAGLRPGMTGDEADRLARQVIEKAGYGEAFGHGLGHGVGLATHEGPRLGPRSQDILTEGMVFTVEPGIYLPGWGGVRIEDMVVLEKDGPRPLTHAPKLRFRD